MDTNISKTIGVLHALQDMNISVEDFKKKAAVAHALKTNEHKDVVYRKVASMLSDILGGAPETANKTSHNMLSLLAKEASWNPAFFDIVDAAAEPLLHTMNVKQASKAAEFAASIGTTFPTLLTMLIGTGAIGGGVAHFADKQIDNDTVDAEKQKAIYNEYLRLANEVDRKAMYAAKNKNLSV